MNYKEIMKLQENNQKICMILVNARIEGSANLVKEKMLLLTYGSYITYIQFVNTGLWIQVSSIASGLRGNFSHVNVHWENFMEKVKPQPHFSLIGPCAHKSSSHVGCRLLDGQQFPEAQNAEIHRWEQRLVRVSIVTRA